MIQLPIQHRFVSLLAPRGLLQFEMKARLLEVHLIVELAVVDEEGFISALVLVKERVLCWRSIAHDI